MDRMEGVVRSPVQGGRRCLVDARSHRWFSVEKNAKLWSAESAGRPRLKHWLNERIVLKCAAGSANEVVAREIGVSRLTVGRWRRRFVTHHPDGLLDEPRPGAPRKITDEHVERVVR